MTSVKSKSKPKVVKSKDVKMKDSEEDKESHSGEEEKERSEDEEGEDDKGGESEEEENDEKGESEGEEDEDDEGEEESSEGERSDDEPLTNYVSKVVLKKPKVKKPISESDSDSKEHRAKKPKRAPTTNKRKRVSEEEKVSKPKISMEKAIVEVKPKKVLKPKKEPVLKIEDKVSKKVLKPKKERLVKIEEEVSKKGKSDRNEKKKKPLGPEEIEENEYFPALLCRTVPTSLFSTIRDARVNMQAFLTDIGFSSLYGVNIETLPSRIARFVVENFDKESYKLKLDNGHILVTPEKIHEILGVPVGGISFFELAERSVEDPFVIMWLNQFSPKKYKEIRASDVAGKLISATKVDFMFKVNFLTLFSNVMAKAHTMKALVDLTIVRRISESTVIANIDWCGYIYKLLKDSEKPKTLSGYYNGALCFLIVSFPFFVYRFY